MAGRGEIIRAGAGMVADFDALRARRTKADAYHRLANRIDDAWLVEPVWFSGSAGGRCGGGGRWWVLLQPSDASPWPGACAAACRQDTGDTDCSW
jgi:hypothetical protein